MDAEATRTCGQCHKDIAEANFALHETHCSRFLCLCPDCDESVPRDQLKQHKEDQHTTVRCSKCNKKMEHRFLADHKSDECVERLQTCQFCQLELPWKELHQHCLACGSRTELCGDCGRYVKLSDKSQHDLTCSATNGDISLPQTAQGLPTKLTVTSSTYMAPVQIDDADEHELEYNTESRWDFEEAQADEEENGEDFYGQVTSAQISSTFKSTCLSNTLYSSPLGYVGDPNQISTCPHCHLALPVITLRWHKVKCQRYILLK